MFALLDKEYSLSFDTWEPKLSTQFWNEARNFRSDPTSLAAIESKLVPYWAD